MVVVILNIDLPETEKTEDFDFKLAKVESAPNLGGKKKNHYCSNGMFVYFFLSFHLPSFFFFTLITFSDFPFFIVLIFPSFEALYEIYLTNIEMVNNM